MALSPCAAVYALGCLTVGEPDTDRSWYARTRHGEEFVNVPQFGAKGDGVADDTLAIQRAVNHNRLQVVWNPDNPVSSARASVARLSMPSSILVFETDTEQTAGRVESR